MVWCDAMRLSVDITANVYTLGTCVVDTRLLVLGTEQKEMRK